MFCFYLIICFFCLFVFTINFVRFLFFSKLKTNPDATEDSIPDSNLHVSLFFVFQHFFHFFFQNQHCAVNLFFLFFLVFCRVYVFSLFFLTLLLSLAFPFVFSWVRVFLFSDSFLGWNQHFSGHSKNHNPIPCPPCHRGPPKPWRAAGYPPHGAHPRRLRYLVTPRGRDRGLWSTSVFIVYLDQIHYNII